MKLKEDKLVQIIDQLFWSCQQRHRVLVVQLAYHALPEGKFSLWLAQRVAETCEER